MKAQSAVGSSKRKNSFEAGKSATEEALKKLGDTKPSMALVFATTGYNQLDILKGVAAVAPGTPVSGCSAEGVICNFGSAEEACVVSVMLFCGDNIQFETFNVSGLKADSGKCGRELAAKINASKNIDKAKVLFLFPDGLTANCSQMIEKLEGDLKTRLLILGGNSADLMTNVTKTYQYYNGEAVSDSASAVLVSGDLQVDFEVSHGCEMIGLDLTVTKAVANQLQEIDGRSAWTVFREYLNGNPTELLGHDMVHLCFAELLPETEQKSSGNQYMIRNPLNLDKEHGYLTTPAEIKTGSKIRIARREPERIINDALKSAKAMAARSSGNEPFAILQFECCGRGSMLFGTQTNSEITLPLQKQMGHTDNWIGFHTFGELAPMVKGGETQYHSYTMVLCALYEKKAS